MKRGLRSIADEVLHIPNQFELVWMRFPEEFKALDKAGCNLFKVYKTTFNRSMWLCWHLYTDDSRQRFYIIYGDTEEDLSRGLFMVSASEARRT